MTRYRTYALLGALLGLVALVCATIIGGFALLDGSGIGPRSGGLAFGDPWPSRAEDRDAEDGDQARDQDSNRDAARDRAQDRTRDGLHDGVQDRTRDRASDRTRIGTAEPSASDSAWTATWAAAPAGAEPGAPFGRPGRTMRNVVHTSIGGTAVRVTLSNLYSSAGLLIGHASVAVRDGEGAAAVPGTMRRLTFARQSAVTVPPHGQIISDPVELPVPYDGDLLVTLHTPAPGGPVTYHPMAFQTSYLARGDRTEDLDAAAYTEQTGSWRYVTAVDVLNRESPGTVVTFGDSITDGDGSKPDANRRWPDTLAARLRDQHIGVVNAAISGNQVLGDQSWRGCGESGLARFRRDVLGRAGVRAVVIDLGVNDILRGGERDPARITAGLRELTRQAHARGIRVVGATLLPFGAHRGYDDATEAVREQVNDEIRSGGIFDEVVDFDQVLSDPYAPDRIRPVYDSGDGLHPSDAGYLAMGRHFDLTSLEGKVPAEL
ncbi:SGNH/GDSL hydrolase family protein [Streptomyces odonnellii]|uniref:SGNH/GDSL hydrolase family protein n=1 Tax=Streptomyces odonnellii TaxID=1417980 RepID=UPI001E58D795|nr:SGNH/GDSL hydrolase family protein [Streptomyces odonnellii]